MESDAGTESDWVTGRMVVHCKKEKYDVYIGRAVPRSGLKASVWGNPFVLGKDGTREEIMVKYRAWLMGNEELLARLPELRGKVLGCWCAPLACHGDILSEMANRQRD
jgi:hypothetical protein